MHDAIIVGAGPAGLSAALLLGRCRRTVLVFDRGTPRNAVARGVHGYLTRDGVNPHELRRLGREELQQYGIGVRDIAVASVDRIPGGFEVTLANGEHETGSTLLIATGVMDRVPDIEGLKACYGISAFHCPYCDGWEVRGRKLAVFGQSTAAVSLALALKTWSDDVVLCLHGSRLNPRRRSRLEGEHVEVIDGRIARVEHDDGLVRTLTLDDGSRVACGAIFFSGGQHPQCDIPKALGCELTKKGVVKTDRLGQTCVPGLYVVGDASRDVQFAIVAAAEGAKAGVAINTALQAMTVKP